MDVSILDRRLLKHEATFIAFTLKFPANAYHNPFNKKKWRRFKLCRHKRTLMLSQESNGAKSFMSKREMLCNKKVNKGAEEASCVVERRSE